MGGLQLVIVDDSRHVVDAIARFARWRGFEPKTFTSALTAEAAIADMEVRPAGAIVDVYLDRQRTGFELCDRLRARFGESIHIAMMTGYARDADFAKHHAGGGPYETLEKPLARAVLDDVLRTAVIVDTFDGLGTSPHDDPGSSAIRTKLCSTISAQARRAALTAPEARLFALLATGVQRRDLALASGLSANTVKSQVKSLLRKLETNCTEDIVALLLKALAGPGIRAAQ